MIFIIFQHFHLPSILLHTLGHVGFPFVIAGMDFRLVYSQTLKEAKLILILTTTRHHKNLIWSRPRCVHILSQSHQIHYILLSFPFCCFFFARPPEQYFLYLRILLVVTATTCRAHASMHAESGSAVSRLLFHSFSWIKLYKRRQLDGGKESSHETVNNFYTHTRG